MKPYNPIPLDTHEPISTAEVFSIWILVILMLINCITLIYLINNGYKNNVDLFYIFIALCLTQFIFGCFAIGVGRRKSGLRLAGEFALWLSSIALIGTLLVIGFVVASGAGIH